jgi:DNA-binding MarR family transcriptional regulator
MSRFHDYYNEQTGEQASAMLIIKGAKYPKGMKFATIFADGARRLSEMSLTGTELRVVLALVGMMDFGNWIRKSQADIAARMGMAPSNLSSTLRTLVDRGLIAKLDDPEDKGRSALRINLHLAWKGNAKAWTAAINAGEGTAFTAAAAAPAATASTPESDQLPSAA